MFEQILNTAEQTSELHILFASFLIWKNGFYKVFNLLEMDNYPHKILFEIISRWEFAQSFLK